ncbi:MAG: hypothetical protein LQ352_006257 [Teloschistes flavicans]|nr:MAG: hypothetical protein LQ352_006257 [Teloschistes flavicans]
MGTLAEMAFANVNRDLNRLHTTPPCSIIYLKRILETLLRAQPIWACHHLSLIHRAASLGSSTIADAPLPNRPIMPWIDQVLCDDHLSVTATILEIAASMDSVAYLHSAFCKPDKHDSDPRYVMRHYRYAQSEIFHYALNEAKKGITTVFGVHLVDLGMRSFVVRQGRQAAQKKLTFDTSFACAIGPEGGVMWTALPTGLRDHVNAQKAKLRSWGSLAKMLEKFQRLVNDGDFFGVDLWAEERRRKKPLLRAFNASLRIVRLDDVKPEDLGKWKWETRQV